MNGDRPIRSLTQTETGVNPASLSILVNSPLTIDPSCALIEEGFSLARDHEIESICTVANGYVGTRGSLAEGSILSSPAPFLAGVFDSRDGSAASLALVALPDWTQFRILGDRVPLALEAGEILEHRRILDLQHGLLFLTWRHRDRAGRVTSLQFVRMVFLHDRHLLLQSITINPENYGGVMAIESSIEARDARSPRKQWQPMIKDGAAFILESTTRGATIAMVHHSEVRNKKGQPVERASEVQADRLIERWTWPARTNEVARFTRLVVVYSSRDTKDPTDGARDGLRKARDAGADAHIARHAHTWEECWRDIGLHVTGAMRRLNTPCVWLPIILGAPSIRTTSIVPSERGLTGPVYKGHVFWDTEIYLLPFYTFTDPPSARALLMYRFHTLPAAREKARRLGYQGALYAWKSADTGDDVTPDSAVAPDGRIVQILTGTQEHHISADIAYAVWQYWQATADEAFFVTAGIEILIETARFWATRGRLERDGRYHIRAVIGPVRS